MRARPDSGSTNLLKVTWTFRQNDPRMQAGCTPQANGRRGPSHLFADYRMSMNDWLIVCVATPRMGDSNSNCSSRVTYGQYFCDFQLNHPKRAECSDSLEAGRREPLLYREL